MTKLKDLLAARGKLEAYDELMSWKNYFESNTVVKMGDGKPFAYEVVKMPNRIKDIITRAIQSEISKLDKE